MFMKKYFIYHFLGTDHHGVKIAVPQNTVHYLQKGKQCRKNQGNY
jgi:hypothetical protein